MEELLERTAQQTDATEVFHLDTTVNLVIFENNKLKVLNTLNNQGAAVRALVKDKLGQAIISDFRDPLNLALRIRRLAENGDQVEYDFAGKAEYPELNLIDDQVRKMEASEIVKQGQEAVNIINDYDPDILVSFIGERSLDKVKVMTSKGADASYERMFYSYGILTELVDTGNILRIAKYAKGISMPRTSADLARNIIELIKLGRNNVSFKSGKLRVIFAPSALADVLMAFTGAVDGALVAQKVSPLTDRIGEQILDTKVSILDDPHHPDGIMSAPCDDEGTPTRKKAVVDKGMLKSFITDRKSAAQLNGEPTGNGFRAIPFERYKSFAVGVSTDFSNLVMQGGSTHLETLRKETDVGIEIHQINGILLGDLIGGDFSGSLETAFLIKNGERVGRVKDAMIGGNFYKIFKDKLVDLSVEQEWSGTFGGCSGAFLLPWACAEDVDISGSD